MKKALALTSLSLAAFALPLVSLAAVRNLSDAGSFLIDTINNILVPVLFAAAFIVFLFGAFFTFIVGANNEEVKEKGKNLMRWGLIGFFVMVSVWGLVNILTGSISFGNNTGVTPPEAGGGGAGKEGLNAFLFQFVVHGGDEAKRKEGRSAIFWGIIGLVIIFGAYGVINVALGTFSLGPIKPLPR